MKKFMMAAAVAATLMGCANQPATTEPVAQVSTSDIVLENIMTRVSVRKFQAQPVSRDTLDVLIKAGLQAPSAMNSQDWEVRVVDNAQTLKELSDLMLNTEMGQGMKERLADGAFYGAPAVFFVAAKKGEGGFSVDNTALLSENILLAAHAMGLGSVYVAAPAMMIKTSAEATEYIKKFGFSEDHELHNLILVGYPAETPAPKDRDASKAKYVD